jgi:hypothetical protein
MTNIAPTDGSLAQSLLAKFPVAPNGIIGGLLQQFSWTLTVNGTPYACLFGSADPTGAVNLSCVLTTMPAQIPVHSAGFTCVVSNEACTQALGWTVTPGDFLVVVSAANGTNIAGASVSGTAMKLVTNPLAPNYELPMFILPNAPAATSVTINYASDNSAQDAFVVMEFSGVSASAAKQGTEAFGGVPYGQNSTWTAPSAYLNPTAGALVIGCVDLFDTNGLTSIAPAKPWALGAAALYPVNTASHNLACGFQANAAAGSYTFGGVSSGGYSKFNFTTVGFK